jgi:phospholipase C
MPDLDKIKTIVLLMFENRSFDHMLGHLSSENIMPDIEGFKNPISNYVNDYKGDNYKIYNFQRDSMLPFDLPHEHDYVAMQLARSGVTKKFTMDGFVKAYAKALEEENGKSVIPNPETEAMGYFNSSQVPITSFLAQNFCACDNWFCSLPTSTQPNRVIAFCGDSGIFDTKTRLIETTDSIFDWMERAKIRWRVYHDGLSFFAMFPDIWKYVLGDNFRDYEYLYNDMLHDPVDDAPQVIIVEPSYESAPHIGADLPNDNHAPLPVGWGEDFLRRTYEAVIANPDRWENTVFIVYYDEHGGFYDHVPPPLINYTTTGNPSKTFDSLGPRIPGIIVSPFVEQGAASHTLLDHTSVLQFLAEKFTPGIPYSKTVDDRKQQGISSISETLTNETKWDPPLPPSQKIEVSSALGDRISVAPTKPIEQAFELAAMELIKQEKDSVSIKYPELFQWKDAVDKNR